ncbi:MAG TPA: lysophospholipid acyltransferase family protein [Candidatus Xenobia bacterium]|jgi:1-acyl-sn-glycerol-3-phosphate acyltransferase
MVPLLLLVTLFIDPLEVDWPVRQFCRILVRLAGMQVSLSPSPDFDSRRACIFVANHVNLFDPFVAAAVLPQPARGLELASHFKIPLYGPLMKRFGNIPVVPGSKGLPDLQEAVDRYLKRGVSVVIYPEGQRTRDGQVARFRKGSFVIARALGAPVVPVTQVGAWEYHRKGAYYLSPGPVVLHLGPTLDPNAYPDVESLAQACQDMVTAALAGETSNG